MEDSEAIIFVVKPTQYMLDNYKSFAWVVKNENDVITDIEVKDIVPGINIHDQYVLIGSFYVKDSKLLDTYIDYIFANKLSTNNEYYLDNAFKAIVESNRIVKAVVLEDYMSFGTPDEYNENKYWYEIIK